MTRKSRSRREPVNKRNHKGKSYRQKASSRGGRTPSREKERQLLQLEDKIVGFIFSRGGQASRKEIAAGLQLPSRGRRKDLEQTLKALCLGKTLSCKGDIFRNHNVKNLVEATISSHPRGFAFARPLSQTRDTRENDIFIPPGATSSANHGDRALIRLTRSRRDKQEGRVITVLQRSSARIVGTYQANGLVVPEDDRLTYQVRVVAGKKVEVKKNDVVVVEVVDFPDTGQNPDGRIVKVLGNSKDPSVQADIVIYLHDLPHEFSSEVLAQVKGLDGKIVLEPGRTDLRDIQHVTIDGETAKDFDDAVAIEKDGKIFRLYVSIADVSHYVRPGTPLDKEAYQRGTSVYFPGRVVPMLPERLSNDLCSLVPDQDRLAFTAILDLDRQGKLLSRKFTRSVIRSYQRFTYNTVFEILSAEPGAKIRDTYKPFVADLDTMAKLAEALEKKRQKRGSIGFEIPEPLINLDKEGRIDNIARSQRNQAHKMIEEFMLAANEAVAGAFSELEDPAHFDFLYRIHERPDAQKVEEFVDFAKRLGIQLGGQPEQPSWFAAIIETVKGSPKEYIISNLLLRTMQQARYSPSNAGHFGLAASDYCHFTSPIRRYPDLMVHRALQRLVSDKERKAPRAKTVYDNIDEAGLFLSDRERTAVAADREMVERLQVRYMADKIDEEFTGIVSGVASFGIFIELLDSFISGAIPIADLTGDYFEIDEKNYRVLGKNSGRIIQIGDQIQVRVREVNIHRRRVNFTLADQA
jgi:ribonuclease R